MDPVNKLEKILKNNRHNITKTRLRVFEMLLKLNKPISISDLILLGTNIDKVSVYRTIDLFEKLGIVHRVWTGFKSKIELSEDFSSHHHHFTCLNCSKTINIESPKLEKELHDLESRYRFQLIQHSVELSGYCIKCRADSN